MASIADYHNDIYAAGLADIRPPLPTDLTRLEPLARRRLSDTAYGYVAGSAGSGATARANRAAFDRWRIVPRFLRDVSAPDLGVTVLDTTMPAPVILGPIGVLGLYPRDAESPVARATGALGGRAGLDLEAAAHLRVLHQLRQHELDRNAPLQVLVPTR